MKTTGFGGSCFQFSHFIFWFRLFALLLLHLLIAGADIISVVCIYCRIDGVENVPFSPPAHDESFFYIRYPTGTGGNSSSNNNEKMSISEAIQASTAIETKALPPAGSVASAVKGFAPVADQKLNAKVDLSKHTEPCRQYLAGVNCKY